MDKGLIHLYSGNGKGKTTAAMGLALRALAAGKKVVIVQFLKGAESGEITLLKQLGAQVFRGKNRHSPSPPFLSGVTAIIAHPLKAADEDRLLRGGGQSMRAFYQR